MLARGTSLNLWNAIQILLNGNPQCAFGNSIDFDVLLDAGTRLLPKAVLGVVATEAFGFEVLPRGGALGSTTIPN